MTIPARIIRLGVQRIGRAIAKIGKAAGIRVEEETRKRNGKVETVSAV